MLRFLTGNYNNCPYFQLDDEYGRGIKLKKTAEGYIDATDELAEEENDESLFDDIEKEWHKLKEENTKAK